MFQAIIGLISIAVTIYTIIIVGTVAIGMVLVVWESIFGDSNG